MTVGGSIRSFPKMASFHRRRSKSAQAAAIHPTSIGFRESTRSDDGVSDISDGNEWFYETLCSKFEDGAVPARIIKKYRRHAKERKRKMAATTRRRGRKPSLAVLGRGRAGGDGARISRQLAAAEGAPVRSGADLASIDDVLEEIFQLNENNQSVWRELQALRHQRGKKEKDHGESPNPNTIRAEDKVETSLEEQLVASLSLVEESIGRARNCNDNENENLKELVTDLADELVLTADELKAAKEENRRKSQQISTLENSLKTSVRDLDRTRESLEDHISKTVCMEMDIETLNEELKEERARNASTSRVNMVAEAETDPRRDSVPYRHYGHLTANDLQERGVASRSKRSTSLPSSLFEAKFSSILHEQDAMKKRFAKEKMEMEERHQYQLNKAHEEANAEKVQLLREMYSVEPMPNNKKDGKSTADTINTKTTSSISQTAWGLYSSRSLMTDATKSSSASGSDCHHRRSPGTKGSNGNLERQEPPQTSDLNEAHANKSTKPMLGRNPQQGSSNAVGSLERYLAHSKTSSTGQSAWTLYSGGSVKTGVPKSSRSLPTDTPTSSTTTWADHRHRHRRLSSANSANGNSSITKRPKSSGSPNPYLNYPNSPRGSTRSVRSTLSVRGRQYKNSDPSETHGSKRSKSLSFRNPQQDSICTSTETRGNRSSMSMSTGPVENVSRT